MRDAYERIRDWLAEDFEKKGLDSALVEYQREQWDSFRIKLKRLYRLAMRDGAEVAAQRELVMYLLDTLLDVAYRLTGRKGKIDSMEGNPCLDVLVDLGMQHLVSPASAGETGVRTALLAARRYVRNSPQWPYKSWWEAHRNEVAALADAMLKADHVNYKRTSGYEIALEWCEDVLRGDVLLGEMNRARALACMRSADDPSKPSPDLVDCFKKLTKAEKLTAAQSFLDAVSAGDERAARDALDPLLMEQAKTTLKDMGVLWSDDPNAEGFKRKSTIPYELAVAYFDEKGGWGIDNDDLWRDLQDFYEISFEDDAYRHVFVPFVQDEGTGVGVYLVGVDELGSFVPEARRGEDGKSRMVTIALIDPRLADHEPVEEDHLELKRRNRGYSQHPLKIVPKVESFDSLINRMGGKGLSPDWMDLCKDHIKEQYEYWVYLALSKSIWKKQGFDEVPDDCPDRFRRYFEGQVEPPELFA